MTYIYIYNIKTLLGVEFAVKQSNNVTVGARNVLDIFIFFNDFFAFDKPPPALLIYRRYVRNSLVPHVLRV